MYTTYVFREVKIKDRIKVECVGCGKKLTRVVEAMQTINPYNVNAKGIPKTAQEIRAELPAKLAEDVEYVKKHAKCKACESR